MAKRRSKYKSGLRGYASYARLYKIAQNKARKQGYEMKEAKYSKTEYLATYEAERNDRLAQIAEGERKTIGDINRSLVQEQTFEYTSRQAKAIQKYFEIQQEEGKFEGNLPTQISIRRGKGPEVDWDAISELYRKQKKALMDAGASRQEATEEAKQYISTNLFGSP